MSGCSGPLCSVPASNFRCSVKFSVLEDSVGTRIWRTGLCQGTVALKSRRLLAHNGKFFEVKLVGDSSRPARGVGVGRICAVRTDEERPRRRSKSPNYPPRSPPGSLNSDLEEENVLPLLRGASRRDPNMEADGGYISSLDDYDEEEGEFDEEVDDKEGEGRIEPLLRLLRGANRYILAGITVDTVLNVEPNNVASREVIDRQTPNPDVCIANGMSAMVLDQRLFISFNPFNVYVSQTEVKPGCVLRQSNWSVLEARGLVTSDEVRACKRNMNTFGFVGDLRQAPEISCVYHSESAENQFLKDPSKATLGDGYQPKSFGE
ncbi:uncharacterized protein [Physcomitrium patens]|uniref:uncharacterized protein isoform X2 n=1 Tax=Physcomitrium patens TaxID=3218 RepID=UPI000D163D82|nr:uncharacterized protein LOC112273544 isoform X2 [Physcomitrium patens]|eukprot:XP_024358226.1 uncharacterized protein LOC112273544 isoform X2 [Physcomitrella patens]